MIHRRCPFDPVKDLQEVDQFGYIDLGVAYSQGVVSGDLNPDVQKMNQIEEPESILGKPSDEFDAISLRETVRERGRKEASSSAAEGSGGSE